jgi:hypothetical protein
MVSLLVVTPYRSAPRKPMISSKITNSVSPIWSRLPDGTHLRLGTRRLTIQQLAVVTREIADAGDRWASDGGVVPMMVVDVDPVSKSPGALGV